MTNDAPCAPYRDLLLRHAQAPLDGEQADYLARHVTQCRRCQQELAQWRAIGDLMPLVDAQPPVPFTAAWENLQARLTRPAAKLRGVSNHHDERAADEAPVFLFTSDIPRERTEMPITVTTRFRALISVAVIIILFVGMFFWLHRGGVGFLGGAAPGKTAPILSDLPITSVSGTTDFTIHLHDAYADTTRTLIHFHLDSAQYHLDQQLGDVAANLIHPTLVAADGQTYVPFTGSGGSPQQGWYLEFTPLPIAALQQAQTLTLTAEGIEYTTQASHVQTSGGPFKWQITLSPHPGHTYNFPNAVQVSNGVRVQVQQLDIMPSSTAASDHFPRGVRVILTFSGLPPNTILRDSFTFAAALPVAPNGAVGITAGGGAAVMSLGNNPRNLTGRLAFVSGAAIGLNFDTAPTTVDATGAVQMEAVFFAAVPDLTTQAVLDIADVHLVLTSRQPNGTYATSRQPVALNWRLPLALNG